MYELIMETISKMVVFLQWCPEVLEGEQRKSVEDLTENQGCALVRGEDGRTNSFAKELRTFESKWCR